MAFTYSTAFGIQPEQISKPWRDNTCNTCYSIEAINASCIREVRRELTGWVIPSEKAGGGTNCLMILIAKISRCQNLENGADKEFQIFPHTISQIPQSMTYTNALEGVAC